MRDNLVSSFTRRAVDGAVEVRTLALAGLALVLLRAHGSRAPWWMGGGLVFSALLAMGAHMAEAALLTGELPRLLRGGRL